MVRRTFHLVVFFFAVYAFAFVPLGNKTALEHVLAIVRTREAQEAAGELKGGAVRLVGRLRNAAETATKRAEPGADPTEPPASGTPASPHPSASGTPASPRP